MSLYYKKTYCPCGTYPSCSRTEAHCQVISWLDHMAYGTEWYKISTYENRFLAPPLTNIVIQSSDTASACTSGAAEADRPRTIKAFVCCRSSRSKVSGQVITYITFNRNQLAIKHLLTNQAQTIRIISLHDSQAYPHILQVLFRLSTALRNCPR